MPAEPVAAPLLPEIDAFVHELVRLRLLVCLAALKRADFVFLLRHTGLSRGNLSVQMTKLAEAGLVEVDKGYAGNRPRTVYALTRKGRAQLAAYKADMTELLDALPE
jgi:DNA-binding MarR family transcriptional regulator